MAVELNKNGSWHNKIDDRATLGCAEMCHLCSFRVLTDSTFSRAANIPFVANVVANTFPFYIVHGASYMLIGRRDFYVWGTHALMLSGLIC